MDREWGVGAEFGGSGGSWLDQDGGGAFIL